MSKKIFIYLLLGGAVFFAWNACTSQKNTAVTRWYHSTNSRYNIHFNAQVAYDEALKAKNEGYKDNMTEMLNVFPFDPASLEKKSEGGSFNKVIDKSVKAIKLHSIQKKPIKDASKKNDTKYQKWYSQREFNPFLRNSWLLMAKAEYQNDDYLKSISTFSYITRLFSNDPEAVAEARIWMVMAYGELGWIYEAEDVLKKIELAGAIPKGLEGEFAAANANLLVRQKKFKEAIPYLEKAADKAESQRQRIRLKYLLGQAYEKMGNRTFAYKAYSDIGGLNTPYVFEMNAKLKQAENSEPAQQKSSLSMLDGMVRNPKNKEYLDQVYYAKGNIYMSQADTAHAISAYALAIENSTRKGAEKARVQITLGDLYFQRRQYVKAQPCYSDALGALRKDHEDYERVALRSKVLEQLAQHDAAIILQDSLQTLVRMPEQERLKAIDKIIEGVIKKEKDDKLLADKEKAEANAVGRPGMAGQIDIPVQANTQGGFYYDNEQSISQGKNAFQKKWGNRKLEDNWRRRDKAVSVFAEANPANGQPSPTDSAKTSQDSPSFKPSNDKHTRDFYLQQLPFTKAQIAESDSTIDDAMFQMAGIYHQQLNDVHLGIDTYEKELKRFTATPNKQEAYFRLYMLYHELGNKAMAENYRRKMMAEFPNSEYAKSFAEPNYEWNLQNPRALQDTLYEQSYNAYLKSDINAVRKAYQDILAKYPQSDLMPKFLFLNALTYAQTKEESEFRSNLKEILEKYPQSDVTPVAKDMLKESLSGKSLVGGNPIKGLIWNASFGKDSTLLAQANPALKFNQNDNAEQLLLLVYPLKQINKNDLLYTMADYNFSHYVLSTFDLIFDDQISTGILQVRGFSNFRYLKQYVDDAIKNSLFAKLGENIIPVPISVENYTTLQAGKTLNDYLAFFNQNYVNSLPQVIALWETSQKTEKQKAEAKPAVANQPKAVQEESIPPKMENVPAREAKVDSAPKKDINISNIRVSTSTPVENSLEQEKDKDNEKAFETVDKTVNAVKDAYNNPVEGLKGLLKNIGNKPKLTKEEKQQQKKIQNEQKAEKARLAKIQRELEKAHNDSIDSANRAGKLAQQKAEKEKKELLKTIENQKLAAAKAKEDARKAHEAELLQKERKRKEELKEKEKARKEKLKAREKELKEKERLQKEKQQQREQERQAIKK